jgi:hypothetical protein
MGARRAQLNGMQRRAQERGKKIETMLCTRAALTGVNLFRLPRSKMDWRRLAPFVCFVSVISGHAIESAADVVHRRAGMPSVEGRISKFDDAGVTVERGLPQPEFIRWDFVRDIQIDRAEPGLAPYREIAANLWRARTRLERLDAALAEPIFERLFQRYRGQSHETALIVAEGLLRCRLMRGGNDAAVIPALETIRIRRAIKSAGHAFAGLPAIFDEQTSLCIELPPVWVMSTGLAPLERELSTYNAGTDTTVAALANLYLKALRHQIGARQDENQRALAADHPGVTYLAAVVDLHHPDPQMRAASREFMLRDVNAAPPWQAAWARYFAGDSLLAEADTALHDAGMVNLAYLPARYGEAQPYLTGLALARLAEQCDSAGESAAAKSLRNELLVRFPHHPALATVKKTAANVTGHSFAVQKESL